jgi:hypothetical protein
MTDACLVRSDLPDEVRALAVRLGAKDRTAASSVKLTQRGVMRDRPGSRWMRFRARQTINLRLPNFEWQAFLPPFGLISVMDSLVDGDARLDVTVFRCLRIDGLRDRTAAAKGEIIRYLAELACAPDAILHNQSIRWSVTDGQTLRASAGHGAAQGEVDLRLNDAGRIGSVFATDRPRKEGSRLVERPWHGRFSDYRQHKGRWLPFAGEVGWTVAGQEFVVWRGEMLTWLLD